MTRAERRMTAMFAIIVAIILIGLTPIEQPSDLIVAGIGGALWIGAAAYFLRRVG